jgi:hypothetical protein
MKLLKRRPAGDEPYFERVSAAKRPNVIDQALERLVLCEDGQVRLVQTISYSMVYSSMAVVNEFIPGENGGAFVHLLKLFCQLYGLPVPGEAEVRAYDEAVKRKVRNQDRRLKRRGIRNFWRRPRRKPSEK